MVLNTSVVELSMDELLDVNAGGTTSDGFVFAGSYMLYGAALLAAPTVAPAVAVLTVVGAGVLAVDSGVKFLKSLFG